MSSPLSTPQAGAHGNGGDGASVIVILSLVFVLLPIIMVIMTLSPSSLLPVSTLQAVACSISQGCCSGGGSCPHGENCLATSSPITGAYGRGSKFSVLRQGYVGQGLQNLFLQCLLNWVSETVITDRTQKLLFS